MTARLGSVKVKQMVTYLRTLRVDEREAGDDPVTPAASDGISKSSVDPH
jgi:hypothetical protein